MSTTYLVRAAISAAVILGGPWDIVGPGITAGDTGIGHAHEVRRTIHGSVVGVEADAVRQATPGPQPPPSGIEIAPRPDVQEVPPGAPSTRVDSDLILLPEHLQPGTHTVTLEVSQSQSWGRARRFHDGTSCHELNPFPGPMASHVGWGQAEWGESPCLSFVLHLAVLFDKGPLADVPVQVYDRAVLAYDEREGALCPLVFGASNNRCWKAGDDVAESKPDGCAVVRIPTLDWSSAPPGQIPFMTSPSPAVRQLAANEWDVTEAYNWQSSAGAAPLGANPGFGFLLTGAFTSVDQLEAEDNEVCVSAITNIRLVVTYEIPPSGPPPSTPR